MIVAGSGLRVVVVTRPVDFRKGHDGLVAVVEHELGLDPYSGVVFVCRLPPIWSHSMFALMEPLGQC